MAKLNNISKEEIKELIKKGIYCGNQKAMDVSLDDHKFPEKYNGCEGCKLLTGRRGNLYNTKICGISKFDVSVFFAGKTGHLALNN